MLSEMRSYHPRGHGSSSDCTNPTECSTVVTRGSFWSRWRPTAVGECGSTVSLTHFFFLLGGGLWQPEASSVAAMRRDIDRKPHKIKRVLTNSLLRKEFFAGIGNDEEAAVKAFASHNAESALKTKPKVSLCIRHRGDDSPRIVRCCVSSGCLTGRTPSGHARREEKRQKTLQSSIHHVRFKGQHYSRKNSRLGWKMKEAILKGLIWQVWDWESTKTCRVQQPRSGNNRS